MRSIILHPTSTASWHTLICEAEKASSTPLAEEMESYLVFLLMRFAKKPEIAESILGLDFLHCTQSACPNQPERLRDVGDKCLLFAGLFPERAEKKRIKLNYFVQLGQVAYLTLSLQETLANAKLYQKLCHQFIPLMDVLQATRAHSLIQKETFFTYLERWQQTKSQYAYTKMQEILKTLTPEEQTLLKKWLSKKQ